MAKILLVDDNIDMLDTLEHLFMFYEFDVVRAENGKIGIEIAKAAQPDLIILDALMPVMSGFDACQELKRDTETGHIPIIFLSANYTEQEHRIKGMELGADEYLLKPFNAKELIKKVSMLLHRRSIMNTLMQSNQELIARMETELLQKKALPIADYQTKDALTGLYNNDFFFEYIQHLLSISDGNQQELSLLFVDIDLFRKINDVYGEQIGDYVLLKTANIILKNCLDTGTAFRIKQNKFAVILPGKDESAAYQTGEDIRSAILQNRYFDNEFLEAQHISQKRRQSVIHITSSIGVTGLSPGMNSIDFIRNTETALKKAKTSGRNTTIRFTEIQQPDYS